MHYSGYFDYNATTPLHPAAREAWLEASSIAWHNPSSLYREAGAARQYLEDCRSKVGDYLDCEPEDIIFLSGATEANNAVIAHAAALGLPSIAIGATEHPCVQEPARHHFGPRLIEMPVTSEGITRLDALEEILVREKPGLVALMAANNETGVLQLWPEALALCRKHGALFHCDAAQWIGKKPAFGLGACDFITGSAHKFGGPKGIGFLKVPSAGRPFRSLRGGPQEERRRAGTENLPAIAAMLAAWDVLEPTLAEREPDWLAHRLAFETQLNAARPDIQIIAETAPRLWNTVLLTVPPPTNLKWLIRLSAQGIAVSTGSACSRGAGASEVLHAMGFPDETGSQVLRVSGGWETTEEDWKKCAHLILALIEESA